LNNNIWHRLKEFTNEVTSTNVLIYGDTKTWKTSRALAQTPGPRVVFDGEGGTDSPVFLQYTSDEDRRFTPGNVRDLIDMVEWLRGGEHPFKTIIIDPVTTFWEMIQWEVLEQTARRKNVNAWEVDTSIAYWGRVKLIWKQFVDKLIQSDMHVVFIARGDNKVDGKGKLLGYKFQAEKNLDGLVHTIVCFRRDGTKRWDVVEGDRNGTLKVGDYRGDNFPLDISPLFASGVTRGVDSPAGAANAVILGEADVNGLKRALMNAVRAIVGDIEPSEVGKVFNATWPEPDKMTQEQFGDAIQTVNDMKAAKLILALNQATGGEYKSKRLASLTKSA